MCVQAVRGPHGAGHVLQRLPLPQVRRPRAGRRAAARARRLALLRRRLQLRYARRRRADASQEVAIFIDMLELELFF